MTRALEFGLLLFVRVRWNGGFVFVIVLIILGGFELVIRGIAEHEGEPGRIRRPNEIVLVLGSIGELLSFASKRFRSQTCVFPSSRADKKAAIFRRGSSERERS